MAKQRRQFLRWSAVGATTVLGWGSTAASATGSGGPVRKTGSTAANLDPEFQIGQDVVATAAITVRTSAEVADNVVHTQPAGTAGTVRNGYVTEDGYTWWAVDYGSPTGWSVEEYLEPTGDDGGGDRRSLQPFDTETDLTVTVDVSGADVDAGIRGNRPDSPMIGLGETFVAVQDELSINAVYQAAHAVHESTWGLSEIAREKRNLFGWGAQDSAPYEGARRFDSFEDCVWYVMEQIREGYLTPGDFRYNGPTLSGMNEYYATDPEWDTKIADRYRLLAGEV